MLQGQGATALAWSQQGDQLGIGTAQGSLLLWQAPSAGVDPSQAGQVGEGALWQLPGKHSGPLACAAWSDCDLIASGGPDSQVILQEQVVSLGIGSSDSLQSACAAPNRSCAA